MANIAVTLEKMAANNTAKQMKWQENMSNTSHQREVKDLIKAGLNPQLSNGGNGAPAYTTSVDSAVNALGGIEQARLSSNAATRAAKMNAAAMKAAAYAQAAAQKYAADRHYAASQYSSDISAGANKYYSDKAVEIAKINSNAKINSSTPGLLNKYFGNNANGITSKFLPKLTKALKGVDFGKLFVSPAYASSKNFKLTGIGSTALRRALTSAGLPYTVTNQKILARVILGDRSARKQFNNLMTTTYNKRYRLKSSI